MPPTTRLFWSSMEPNSEVDVDCFLPTGVLIPMGVRAGSTIAEIKGRLWAEASNYPLFNLLKDIRSYVFVCINQKGKQEELVDENRQLIDVRPFRPLLKLIERKGDREEKLLNSEISCLIGKNLDEFDQMQSPEVNDFRRTYRYMVEEISRERNQLNWEGRAMYAYPPEIETSNDIPAHVEQNLMDNRRFLVNVAIKNKRASIKDLHAFNVSADTYPYELLTLVLKRRGVIMGVHDFDNPGDYVLKIVGQESYLLGEHPLLRYKYIRSCVAKGVRPQLSLNLRVSLKVHELLEVPGTHVLKESQPPPPLPAKPSTMSSLSLWHIETQFKFKVVSASNVNVSDDMKVCLRAGIYHGAEPLCDIKSTSPQEGSTLVWDEYLDFDLKVYDLPRMARLCLVIYGYSSSRKKSKARREDTIPLAWANTTLFDFCNHLRQGKLRLYCWPVRDSMEDLNPVGTVVTNINTATSPSLLIEFQRYSNTVVYPPYEKVVGLAAESTSKDIFNLREPQQLQQLKSIVDREPLAPIFEQDKELVWFLRIECRENFPHALPKLLNCMKWNCKEDVAQMQILLQTWPELEPEQALELLDYTYADQAVRRFAVQCIEKMSDVELSQYLLQLVQVLKYESYLDCDLAKFLLRRALLNRNIGHVLFWHLRAEMHMPEASVRFGLMLEAYCRGAVAHIKSLLRQVRALDKMKAISTLLQCLDRDKREKALDTMKQCLQQQTYQEALAKLNSPLEPSYKFLKLRVDKCKFMDSKMRPLWMVFENVDELADDIRILFKNGDDLRQDMLTLQLLRLMDNFWQNEGLDLGMTPYGCLSTGDMVGLIEVVLDSTTLANIQKRKGGGVTKGAFVRSSLLDYIKEYNPDEESLNKAIERFTLSCAGYCVATYVLGVGDRHSDNIMVTREGRLLHIDFGHFLGNFKVKFGVRRERVPFVLTRDFGYVIAKGRSNEIEKSEEFQRFKRICEQAFIILRRKGHLLITLFVMMLSTGIPELRTLDDINYLRKTLALSDKEEEAVKKFRDKFDEAWRNSWKTNANWAVHNYAKNNPH